MAAQSRATFKPHHDPAERTFTILGGYVTMRH